MARPIRWKHLAIAAAAWLLMAGAGAQEALTDPAAGVSSVAEEEVSADGVQARMEQAQRSPDLGEAAKARILDLYRQALEALSSAEQDAAKADEFDRARESAPALLGQIKAELAEPAPEVTVEAAPDAPLSPLEQALTQAEADLSAAQRTYAKLEAEPKRRADRRVEVPRQLADADQQLTEVKEQLALRPAGDPSELGRAERMLLLARERALEQQTRTLQSEMLSYDARRELLAGRRDKATRDLRQAEKRADAWRAIVNQRRELEAEEAVRAARLATAEAHPAIRKLAQENERLAEMRTGPDGLVAKASAATKQLQDANSRLAELRVDFSRTQARVNAVGLTRAIGALLRKRRADLPDVRQYERNIRARQAETSAVQLELLELDEQRAELADVEAGADAVIASLDSPLSAEEREEIGPTVRELLQARLSLLNSLRRDYNIYWDALVDLNAREDELIRATETYADYVDEQILWFRNTAPLHWRDVGGAWQALAWLASPGSWLSAVKALAADASAHLLLHGLALLVLAVLLRTRIKLRAELRRVGELSRNVATDSFNLTLVATALTVVTAALGPFVMWFIGYRLAGSVEAPDFVKGLAPALQSTSAFYLTIAFLRQACRDEGLADAHLRWPTRSRQILRRNLSWLSTVTVPLLLVALTLGWDAGPRSDSLGRMAFMAVLISFAIFLWHVASPRRGVIAELMVHLKGGWLDHLWFLWYPAAVGAPLGLAVAAGAGYYYTALRLSWMLLLTVWLALALLLLYELAVRWLFVARRRLAVERARKRREAEAAEAAEAGAPDLGPQAEAEADELSLYAISAQAQQLLGSLVVVGILVGLWLIWADILPALGILSAVGIWGSVTVVGLGRALLIVAVTAVAARNIPGLLEITILQRLPLKGGVRFAVTSISRYGIIIVGMVLAADAVEIGWEKVQWLVAALTVGLGFGLQEIFANFVSGLIILLERPMRVGDIVTAGDITGTVTRIKMRATTITDWDRKELVVPNKEFITGRLVNWTLSDRVLRLVVPVGIAYGSDTQKAHDLLLQAAREHPDVLAEPEPTALFLGFGDNSLDFELRAFIPSVELRLQVRNDLHMAVDQAFRAAGIKIAFPQRDVHIQSIEAPLRIINEPGEEQPGPE